MITYRLLSGQSCKKENEAREELAGNQPPGVSVLCLQRVGIPSTRLFVSGLPGLQALPAHKGAPCTFPTEMVALSCFAPAGVDTGAWVQGTGDLWLLVLLDSARVQRAALPPFMEWTSYSGIPSAPWI